MVFLRPVNHHGYIRVKKERTKRERTINISEIFSRYQIPSLTAALAQKSWQQHTPTTLQKPKLNFFHSVNKTLLPSSPIRMHCTREA